MTGVSRSVSVLVLGDVVRNKRKTPAQGGIFQGRRQTISAKSIQETDSICTNN